MSYQYQVEEAVSFLSSRLKGKPEIILLLGTGLGGLADQVEQSVSIPYSEIPYFKESTVVSHAGRLVCGKMGGKRVVALKGRLHFYEGYSLKDITFPIRVLSCLGAKFLIISNAAGGLRPNLKPGSLLLITDHLNFLGGNPLRGPNVDSWGPRFADMSRVYSIRLATLAQKAATGLGISLEKGIYVCISGPSIETPAETRFLRLAGADAVGMSTVPEVIVAGHAGLEVLGISVIANINDPNHFQPILLEDVLAQVQKVSVVFEQLVIGIVKMI